MTATETTRSRGHEGIGESTVGHRITARIIRDDDGDHHTVYRFAGKAYPSIEALESAMGGRQ